MTDECSCLDPEKEARRLLRARFLRASYPSKELQKPRQINARKPQDSLGANSHLRMIRFPRKEVVP